MERLRAKTAAGAIARAVRGERRQIGAAHELEALASLVRPRRFAPSSPNCLRASGTAASRRLRP
jgi:hypothetical protein